MHRLVASKYEVVAYGAKHGSVAGVVIDSQLQAYKNIDTISMYLSARHQAAFYDYIISLEPRRVIFNPGTENQELYQLLEEYNISFEPACTLVLLSTNQY